MNAVRPWPALLVLLTCGCGSSTPSADYGDAHSEPARAPLELPLLNINNEPVELAELRGHFVLLFLFATFDLPSQAALEPLREVAKQHPELRVVAIALQPNPQQLLPIFASAFELELPLAYDPENRLLRGLTDVGPVSGVPGYVLLDRSGFITRTSSTPMNADALRRWCGFE